MTEWIQTRHGALAVSRLGDAGPPLWLVPAAGRFAADFEAMRPALAERFRTRSFDWPGCGDSPPLERPSRSTPALFADMLEDLVGAATSEPAVVLGHSVGGFAAARLAARHPARVRGLVLVDAGGIAPLAWHERLFCWLKGRPFVTRHFEPAFARFHSTQKGPFVDAMLRRVGQASRNRAYAETVAALWRAFPQEGSGLARDEAARIRCPTQVLWGAHDPVLTLAKGRWIQRAIAGSQLHVLATGHTPFVEDPEGFVAALQPFLVSLAHDARWPEPSAPRPTAATRTFVPPAGANTKLRGTTR